MLAVAAVELLDKPLAAAAPAVVVLDQIVRLVLLELQTLVVVEVAAVEIMLLQEMVAQAVPVS
jgi:hypothetical protein